jgi:hypothetical protein
MQKSNVRLRTRNAHTRGAAMVEAAVVLPLLILFLGFFTFVHGAYSKRLELQNQTHRKVQESSFGGCSGGAGNLINNNCSTGGTRPPRVAWGSSSDSATGSVSVGSLSRSTKAASTVLCDEQAFGFNFVAMTRHYLTTFYPDAKQEAIEPPPQMEGCGE